jgi:ribonuclease HI
MEEKHTDMLCTITTDASFNPHHKVGGYAFWAVSNTFRITKSGVFKKPCRNPTDAEIKCIINALMVVLHGCEGVTKVIVNTDSMNAIHVLTHDIKAQNKFMGGVRPHNHYRLSYHKVLDTAKSKAVIEFRHVKAHTENTDARSWVNDWCDKEAKKAMRKAVGSTVQIQNTLT